MAKRPTRVLIAGGGIAGPTAAYWLARQGFAVTVVERMPLARVRTSGHAVDLFGPAMDVVEWTGALPAVLAARTRTEVVSFRRDRGRGVDVDLRRLVAGIADRHAEVMRGELATALYAAGRDDVDYRFDDAVATLDQEPDGVTVTFARAPAERFDLVIGADGLHSAVRRAAFGPEDRFRRFLGGYLAIFVCPDHVGLGRRMIVHNAPGRLAALYPVRQTGAARGGFLFRRGAGLPLGPGDGAARRRVLHEVYGTDGGEVPRLLAALDASDDLYVDAISQIVLDGWSRGRVTLVGDAGYSPGPAVGGGTSLAVVGAFVLAQELGRAGGDQAAGLRAYEDRLRPLALQFRRTGPATMRTLIPRTRLQVRLLPALLSVTTRLPAPLQRRLGRLQATPARVLDSVHLAGPPGTP